MAAGSTQDAATPAGDLSKAEGLSQFLAKVLDQLSLTAWLPAAVLVAGITVLGRLRLNSDESPGDVLSALARMHFGALVILLFALVTATVITQSFAFEAIRVLEGYWGANRVTAQPMRLAIWLPTRPPTLVEGTDPDLRDQGVPQRDAGPPAQWCQ